jgi:hypothetical protein
MREHLTASPATRAASTYRNSIAGGDQRRAIGTLVAPLEACSWLPVSSEVPQGYSAPAQRRI